MERMDEEETLEGAGHWEQRRSSSPRRTPGTRIILSSDFLWSSPFPHTQSNCRAMVLQEFYPHSVLCAGTESWGLASAAQPCSLQGTHTSRLELQEGLTSAPASALSHPSESSRGFTGTRGSTPPCSREDESNPSSLEQNEEETNTDLFCL